jgi:hypothetical protein
VIGPDRRLISDYGGNTWTAEQIADDLRRALAR